MTELRFTRRSDDGSFLEFEDESGQIFRVPIEDAVRTAVTTPRLVSLPTFSQSVLNLSEEETVVTVKVIQARLRAGESIEDLARSTGWSPEKIEKFSGPILQERAYVIGIALTTQLRRDNFSPTLEIAVHDQLTPRGVNPEDIEWNSHRHENGTWEIVLTYPSRDGRSEAHWDFDIRNHSLICLDESARWIAGEEKEARAKSATHGLVYPNDAATPPPRLVALRADEDSEIDGEARRDGVTKKARIPSWEDIMFGGKNEAE